MSEFLPAGLGRDPNGNVSGLVEMLPGAHLFPSTVIPYSQPIYNASALRGYPIAIDIPSLGEVLAWDSTAWVASTILFPGGGGGNATSLMGISLCAAVGTPNLGEILAFNGTTWCTSTIPFYGNASSLWGIPLCADVGTPSLGEALVYNGSEWCTSTILVGGGGDDTTIAGLPVVSLAQGDLLFVNGGNVSGGPSSIFVATPGSVATGDILEWNGTNWIARSNNVVYTGAISPGSITKWTGAGTIVDSGFNETNRRWNASSVSGLPLSNFAQGTILFVNNNGVSGGPSSIFIPNPEEGTPGQVLGWNGSNWIAVDQAEGGGNATQLQGSAISTTPVAIQGNVLAWTAGGGGSWGASTLQFPEWAPSSGSYVVLALDSGLVNDRLFNTGAGLNFLDGGPKGSLTVSARHTSAIWNASALQGSAVSTRVATNGQVMAWSSTGNAWAASTITYPVSNVYAPSTVSYLTLSNDAGLSDERALVVGTGLNFLDTGGNGSYTVSARHTSAMWNASAIHGSAISNVIATQGQVMAWSSTGNAWAASTLVLPVSNVYAPSTASYLTLAAHAGLSDERAFVVGDGLGFLDEGAGGNFTVSARHTSAIWNASALQGSAIATLVATNGQILAWSSTGNAWAASTLSLPLTAPSTASYLVLGTDSGLANERVVVPGDGIGVLDGGAGGNYTVSAKNTSAMWNASAMHGSSISNVIATQGQVMAWSSTGNAWAPSTITYPVSNVYAPSTASYLTLAAHAGLSDERAILAGDGIKFLDGGAGGNFTISAVHTSAMWNASALQGSAIATPIATNGQVLAWSSTGNAWAASTITYPVSNVYAPSTASYLTLAAHAGLSDERVFTAGSGIGFLDDGAGGNLTVSAHHTSAMWNASGLQGFLVSSIAPTNNQYLKYSAVLNAWRPVTDSASLATLQSAYDIGNDIIIAAGRPIRLGGMDVDFSGTTAYTIVSANTLTPSGLVVYVSAGLPFTVSATPSSTEYGSSNPIFRITTASGNINFTNQIWSVFTESTAELEYQQKRFNFKKLSLDSSGGLTIGQSYVRLYNTITGSTGGNSIVCQDSSGNSYLQFSSGKKMVIGYGTNIWATSEGPQNIITIDNNSVSCTRDVTLSGSLLVSGGSTFTSSLIVSGNLTVSTNLNVSGDINTGKYPTYSYLCSGVTMAVNTDFCDLFNAAGSNKIIKLTKVYAYTRNTAAITGVANPLELFRTSAVGAAGTVVAASKFDTADADAPAQITFRRSPTNNIAMYAPSAALAGANVYTEEGNNGQTQSIIYELDSAMGLNKTLTLREGQGIKVRSGLVGAAGVISIVVEAVFI